MNWRDNLARRIPLLLAAGAAWLSGGVVSPVGAEAADGAEAVGISVWDLKEDAETYARSAYSGVLKALEPVVEGTPQVQTYEVSNSTFHKIAARASA